MFTGIITDVGEVEERLEGGFAIGCGYLATSVDVGASISCDGVCLTVTAIEARGAGSLFRVDVSNETRAKTSLGDWRQGRKVNLERPVRVGDELGGHVVSGHVDGVADIIDITDDGACKRFSFRAPDHLALYIAPKGCVSLDGTSLTVNEVSGNRFGVNLIPHTLTTSTWGLKSKNDRVNLEVDLFARYVARLMEFRA